MDISGISKVEREAKSLVALQQVGLEKYVHARPDELSGGMRQRVGLARALAINPDILLMDEAFSALDPLIRAEMQDELLKLQSQQQRTIIFISHDLDEAMRIGDRIAIMQNGEVIQVGTPEQIFKTPANDYVRTFFRGVDISQVFTAKDIVRHDSKMVIHASSGIGPFSALTQLQESDRDYGYLVNKQKYLGTVSSTSLKQADRKASTLSTAILGSIEPIMVDTPLNELLSLVANAECALPVIDSEHQFLGSISKTTLLSALDREE